MGRDMHTLYNDAWNTSMHCVLMVAAKESDNHHVQKAMELAGQQMSDGMYAIVAIAHH